MWDMAIKSWFRGSDIRDVISNYRGFGGVLRCLDVPQEY